MDDAVAYAILGVSAEATPEEIRTAYRRRAFDTHPDRAVGSTAAFQAVAEAYRILSDSIGSSRPRAGPPCTRPAGRERESADTASPGRQRAAARGGARLVDPARADRSITSASQACDLHRDMVVPRSGDRRRDGLRPRRVVERRAAERRHAGIVRAALGARATRCSRGRAAHPERPGTGGTIAQLAGSTPFPPGSAVAATSPRG